MTASKFSEELLKRADFFERLSVYGDRKNFLKSLSQDVPDYFSQTQKQEESNVRSFLQMLSSRGYSQENITNLVNALNSNEVEQKRMAILTAIQLFKQYDMGPAALASAQKILDTINKDLEVKPENSETAGGATGPSNNSGNPGNWEGPAASVNYMLNKAKKTVSNLPADLQGSNRKFQVQNGLVPQIRFLVRMYKQVQDPQLKKSITDGLENIFNSLSENDISEIPEFKNGLSSLLYQLQQQTQNSYNPYI